MAIEIGNRISSVYALNETGTDEYTLTEWGTLTGGSFDQTVTGTDAYDTSWEGNHARASYERETIGGGTWTRTGTNAGDGTNGYTLELSGDEIAGHFSASTSGTNRYDLVERFSDISNTEPGVTTPGNVSFHSHGLPFRDPFPTHLDTNRDGGISLKEWRSVHGNGADSNAVFSLLDFNRDGVLESWEWDSASDIVFDSFVDSRPPERPRAGGGPGRMPEQVTGNGLQRFTIRDPLTGEEVTFTSTPDGARSWYSQRLHQRAKNIVAGGGADGMNQSFPGLVPLRREADEIARPLLGKVREGTDGVPNGIDYPDWADLYISEAILDEIEARMQQVIEETDDQRLYDTLDVLGVADPTGIVDIISAIVHVYNGDYEGALFSAVFAIPILGDGIKGFKGVIKGGAKGGAKAIDRVCFVAGTPLLTPDGSRRIEEFRPGDLVLSRDETDPSGPVEAKVVEEVFVRVGPVMRLVVSGHEIGTTREHPFHIEGIGWRCAAELQPGDRLSSHNGVCGMVEAVEDTGEVATVYNMRVADWHTYFVGSPEWGFSVWAHNAFYVVVRHPTEPGKFVLATRETKRGGNWSLVHDGSGNLRSFDTADAAAKTHAGELHPWARSSAVEGDLVGSLREQHVATLLDGPVSKGRNFRSRSHGSSDIDRIGPNGEYIQIGGPAKAKKPDFLEKTKALKEYADDQGARPMMFLSDDTPADIIAQARGILGSENVKIFKEPAPNWWKAPPSGK